jgi:uncharacterized RDD family membrane protein YckC
VNDGGPAVDRAAYAGFWRRFAAYAIDYALLFLASALLTIVATELDVLPDDAPQLSAVVLAGYLLYCALFESSRRQATLGKLALGLKVTGLHGERIGIGRAVARFFARLLSVLTLCLGYLLIVVTKRRQGLHDFIAGTLVAYDATPRRPAWLVLGVSAGALIPLLALLSAGVWAAYRDYAIRTQVTEGMDLAREYRNAIEAQWRNSPRGFVDLSSDSLGRGLPHSGQYVESIEVVSGMIVISYGGAASEALAGSVLTLVPALGPQRALGWACGYGLPPAGFETVFEGHAGYTDIEQRYIPSSCRSAAP